MPGISFNKLLKHCYLSLILTWLQFDQILFSFFQKMELWNIFMLLKKKFLLLQNVSILVLISLFLCVLPHFSSPYKNGIIYLRSSKTPNKVKLQISYCFQFIWNHISLYILQINQKGLKKTSKQFHSFLHDFHSHFGGDGGKMCPALHSVGGIQSRTIKKKKTYKMPLLLKRQYHFWF